MNPQQAEGEGVSPIQWKQPDERPGLGRRGLAKLIDLIATGFTVVGFTAFTHSHVAGLLIGYAWLALSDSGGSLGKWLTGLTVRHYRSGAECSAVASVLRNLPILLVSLPQRLHQAALGMGREAYREQFQGMLVLMAGLAAVTLIAMIASVCRTGERRHLGDLLAGTIVTVRRRGRWLSEQETRTGNA